MTHSERPAEEQAIAIKKLNKYGRNDKHPVALPDVLAVQLITDLSPDAYIYAPSFVFPPCFPSEPLASSFCLPSPLLASVLPFMSRIPRIHELPDGEYILPAVHPVHADIGFQSGLDYEQQKDVCLPYISSSIT